MSSVCTAVMPTPPPPNPSHTHTLGLTMTSSIPTSANIIESLSEPVPKILGQPIYTTLKSAHDALKANAFSYATTYGGGQHSYLDLIS